MKSLPQLAMILCMVLATCSCGVESTQPVCCDHHAATDKPTNGVSPEAKSESSPTDLTASDAEAKAWAEKTLAELSLEQKVGQMICEQMQGTTPLEGPDFEKLLDLVRNKQIGAFCVYNGSPEKTAALYNRLQKESKIPLFISMDFEGGPGQQLKGATEFPANMALAAAGSEELAYEVGKVGATEGRAVGAHITYSPVVDVSTRPENPTSSVRSFGGDIDLVSRMAAAYVKGYQDNGMIATAKHFPGRGDVDAIPGTKFAANNKPADRVEAEDFRAFKAAIDAGVTYIMSEHVSIPSLTDGSDLPASVNKALATDWLRGKLGFKGVLTTDDMWYPKVTERFGPVKACVMAVQAGHDAVLKPADVGATIDGLVKAVKDGEISEDRIDNSVKKILYWKARLNLHKNRMVDVAKVPEVVRSKEHLAVLDKVADRSMTLLANKDVLPVDMSKVKKVAHISVQKKPVDQNVAEIAATLAKSLPGVEHFALGAKDAPADVNEKALEAAKAADLVIVSLLCQRIPNGNRAPIKEADAKLLEEVFKAKPNATVVMSYGNPYFAERLPGAPALLVGYGESGWYGNQTIYADSLVRLLNGEYKPTGKLPVEVSDEYPIGTGLTY